MPLTTRFTILTRVRIENAIVSLTKLKKRFLMRKLNLFFLKNDIFFVLQVPIFQNFVSPSLMPTKNKLDCLSIERNLSQV
jgi:hypothetical protein